MERDPQNTDFTQESNSSENQNNNNNSTGNAEKGNPESNTYYRKRTYDSDNQQQNSNTYYKKPQQYNNDGQQQNSNTYYKKPQNRYNNDGGGYNNQNQNSNTYYKKPQQYNQDGQQQNSNTYYKKPQQYNQDGQQQNSSTYYKKPQQYNNDGQNQNSSTYYKKPQNRYNNDGGGNYQNNNNYQRRPYNNNQGGGGYNNQRGGGYNQRQPYNNRNNNYNNYQQEPLETFTNAPVLPNEREDKEGMRINKYIAHAGLCARRKADDFIRAGRIYINGEVMDQVGYRVKASDVVTLDGADVKPTKKYVYVLLNKPRNVISTADDEQGRRTVMDLITPLTEERVYPVGRLDRDTTGLVLLTNDGELAQRLAQPSHEVKKIYEITLDKPLEESDIEKIRQTVELEDGPVHVDRVEFVHDSPPNVIGMELSAGRNRVVRRLFEHLGYRVTKLDRVKYAMLTKKGLPRGKCRFLDVREINMLKYLF